ncbi:MAG: DUF2254 family protein [Candidatus Neomarinimicrobiota bacterium]
MVLSRFFTRFNISQLAKRWYARIWQGIYRLQIFASLLKTRYSHIVTGVLLVTLFLMSGFLYSNLQNISDPYFSNAENFADFKTLLVILGGSLIGAAAIAFSLVMFAMQINVERMPYGLFRKFSSDGKLLGAFFATFLLSLIVAILSLIPDKSWAALAALIAGWGTALIIVTFLYAYRRALSLISPMKQLALVATDTRKNLQVWARRAKRIAPLLEDSRLETDKSDLGLRNTHDLERAAFFQIDANWTAVAKQATAYCISISRRYAAVGDHEVSSIALAAIVAINAEYIKAKGKTFFQSHYWIDNPLSNDGFITDTLEHLRQNILVGISRGDEQQIEQTLRTMATLCRLFHNIDYSTTDSTKTHANLAAAYLSGAAESVAPHNMTDVLMEGMRLMGTVGIDVINKGNSIDISTISEKIGLISCTGVVQESHRPVTEVGLKQLARITFELIRSDSHDIRFAVGEVRGDVKRVADILLTVPDTPFPGIHSTLLGPYYSSTSTDALTVWLMQLVNAISEAKADDKDAQRVIKHFVQWADGLYGTEKDLLLLAIEKRSHFAFDIIRWIAHTTKILLALSNSPACDSTNRDRLRKSALWLFSVFSFVPNDQEILIFVENYQMTEMLLDGTIEAHRRDCYDIALDFRKLLLDWTFRAGKYQTGEETLHIGICGLATVNILMELDDSALVDSIRERFGREGVPSPDIRIHAAEEIRKSATTLAPDRYLTSRIEVIMSQVDEDRLRTLLIKIADVLSQGS